MDKINFVDVIWFGTLAISCVLYHALNLLYPLFEEKETVPISKGRAFVRENPIEKKTILEAWPCLRLELNFIKGKLFHYVGSDGVFVVSPGEL